jgi:sporulation protein YlmC with PRC-barrel domain
MNLYLILRRNGWSSTAELQEAAAVSMRIGNEEMPDEVRWIRSYVLDEGEGTVGTVCIYQGVSEQAVREHAKRAGIPADEVIPVLDTVLVRPDPEPAAANA